MPAVDRFLRQAARLEETRAPEPLVHAQRPVAPARAAVVVFVIARMA
jgi:hypothetical protein